MRREGEKGSAGEGERLRRKGKESEGEGVGRDDEEDSVSRSIGGCKGGKRMKKRREGR